MWVLAYQLIAMNYYKLYGCVCIVKNYDSQIIFDYYYLVIIYTKLTSAHLCAHVCFF